MVHPLPLVCLTSLLWSLQITCVRAINSSTLPSIGLVFFRLIHGFVSREKADELMRDCPVGTFLLRFKASEISDSQSANNTAILAPSAVVDIGGNILFHMSPYRHPSLMRFCCLSLKRWQAMLGLHKVGLYVFFW